MAAPSVGELLQTIGAFLTAAVGVALGVGTLVQRSRSGQVDSFQAVNTALQAENKRCWEENSRLRKERDEIEDEKTEVERARNDRIKQVHKLNNQLQVCQMMVHEYMTRYGKIKGLPTLDENGDPQ